MSPRPNSIELRDTVTIFVGWVGLLKADPKLGHIN